MRPRLLNACLCLIGLCLSVGSLQAQFTWTGNSTNNGAITDPLNWGGSAPTGSGSETLTFGSSGAQTNVLVPTSSFASVTFDTGRPAYTFNGTGATPVLTLNGNVTVASGNNVTFANTLGVVLASAADHVVNVGASTTVQVDGVVSGGGHLSKTGTGTLVLTGANTFNYSGGLGFVNSTVVHAGTLEVNGGDINHGTNGDLFVGENSGDSATLLVSNGGDISGYFGVLGQGNSSSGTATVTGAGSSWTTTSGMGIGYGGTGTLDILAGATVTTVSSANNADSYLGYSVSSSGSATVSGTGSTWTTAAGLIVGKSGVGTLRISSGGAVSSATGKVGEASGSNGSVTINGNASSWTVSGNDLYVGNGGDGALYLYNQGKVNVNAGNGTINLGHSSGGQGTLYIGTDGESAYAGGIVNATTVTTGAGSSGKVQFATNTTSVSPYYFTDDGTSGGGAVQITGPTQVEQLAGYNVIGAANSYTGGTIIDGGTLQANDNSALGSGSVLVRSSGTLTVNEFFLGNNIQVNSGGRLAGISGGYTNANIVSGGILAPGFATTGAGSIATLNFEDLTLGQNGIFEINVSYDSEDFVYDQAMVQNSSTLTINATPANRFKLKVISMTTAKALGNLGGLTLGNTYSWLILDTNGISDITSGNSTITPSSFEVDTSAFSTLYGTGAAAGTFTVTQTGNDIYLNFTPVPEPSTYALMAAGLVLAGLGYRRKKRRN